LKISRIAEISSSSGARLSFTRTLLTPAAWATLTTSSLLWVVNIRIGSLGAILEMCSAAISPFIIGMCRSKITTSGFNSSTFAIACCPFSASPHIRQVVLCSMLDLMTLRINGLSSNHQNLACHVEPKRPRRVADRGQGLQTAEGNQKKAQATLVFCRKTAIQEIMYVTVHTNIRWCPLIS
jgi:hypothetical protein